MGKQFTKEYQPPPKWTEKKAIALGKSLIRWLKKKDENGNDTGNMFFEEYLVLEKDLYPDLLRYLKEKYTSFSELLTQAKKIQEIKLVKYGVADRLNSNMTKFVLANHHNYSEKTIIKDKSKFEDQFEDMSDDELVEHLEKVNKKINDG